MKEFYNKIEILKKVYVGYNYNLILPIRDAFIANEQQIQLHDFDYNGNGIFSYHVDKIKKDPNDYLKDKNSWSTYQNCVEVYISLPENNLLKSLNLEVKIYSGDNITGDRTSLRWSGIFNVNTIFAMNMPMYVNAVEMNYQSLLTDILETHEEKKRERKREIISKMILHPSHVESIVLDAMDMDESVIKEIIDEHKNRNI